MSTGLTHLEHGHAAGKRRLAAGGSEGVGAAAGAGRDQHPPGVGQLVQNLRASAFSSSHAQQYLRPLWPTRETSCSSVVSSPVPCRRTLPRP